MGKMKRIVRKELEDSILKLTYEDRIQIGRIRTDENMTMWYGSFPATSAALCSYHHSKAVSLFRDFTDTKYDILMIKSLGIFELEVVSGSGISVKTR